MRGVAALALAMSLAVTGACGAGTTAEKASAEKDQRPGRSARAASSTAAASGSGSRGGMPQGSEPVKLDPADFSVNIDNPYWPMSQGSKWVYSETDTKGTNQKVVVEVTDETKMIANGIEALAPSWQLAGWWDADRCDHPPNRRAERAFALAASSSRSLGGAVVSREASKRSEILAMSSTAE
jgi:hypothetical protein